MNFPVGCKVKYNADYIQRFGAFNPNHKRLRGEVIEVQGDLRKVKWNDADIVPSFTNICNLAPHG